ncbi:MAG: hypothetical protein IPG90_16860 [Bacteroidetes bacterium]|nr:hypothetical protein [Bacteroidota bacterium]
MATKPTDSSRYSSVAIFLASGNLITYENYFRPLRYNKKKNGKKLLSGAIIFDCRLNQL